MAGAVAALYAVAVGNAVVGNDYGKTDVDVGLLLACDVTYGTGGAHLDAARALGTAEATLERHLGLHHRLQLVGWAQHLVGTFAYAELAGGATAAEVVEAQRAGGLQRNAAVRYLLLLHDGQSAVHTLLLRLDRCGSGNQGCGG